MQRFFVAPERLAQGQVEFSPEQSRQIAQVLRMHGGESVAVLDNAGWVYDVELIDVTPVASRGVIRSRGIARGEPRTKLTLYPALLKSDKLEFVFQKGTELGVIGFVPVISDRCNVGLLSAQSKRSRWERIIVEAAEQTERGRLPQLQPATLFPQACETARGLSFIAWERGERPSLGDAVAARISTGSPRPFGINLFVGPEGGFTDDEIKLAASYGIIPVSLGPRILRAETASIVGATLVLAYSGDLQQDNEVSGSR